MPEHVAELSGDSRSRSRAANLRRPRSGTASGPAVRREREPPSRRRRGRSDPGRVPWGQRTPARARGARGGRGVSAGGADGLLEAVS